MKRANKSQHTQRCNGVRQNGNPGKHNRSLIGCGLGLPASFNAGATTEDEGLLLPAKRGNSVRWDPSWDA